MSSGKGFAITSAQKKNVILLEKYRCRICQKWKEPASFSQKELNNFAAAVAMGRKVNGITANLRCRVCAGGAVTEKQCEGACKMWKDLQEFSKSARSNGGSQSCKACTSWVETQEPDMVTQAPPTGNGLGGDDDDDDNWGPPSSYSDPEAGESGSDFEDYPTTTSNAGTARSTRVPAPAPGVRQTPSTVTSAVRPLQHIAVPYNALAGLSLNGSNTISNPGTGHTMVTANISAPTLSGARIPPGSALLSGSGTASGVGSRNAVNQAQFDLASQSSVSNPYENSSSTQVAPWGAIDARRRPAAPVAPVNYTGWDNRGNPHAQQRFPSGSDSQAQSQQSTSSAPAPAANVQHARSSNWARPVGSRTVQRTAAQAPGGTQPGFAGPPHLQRPLAEPRPDEDSDSDDDLYKM